MAAPFGLNRAVKSFCRCRHAVQQLKWDPISVYIARPATTSSNEVSTPASNKSPQTGFGGQRKAKQISQAMRYYLEVRTKQDKFMEEQVAAFEMGKRHLANIMGLDPDDMNHGDIEKAIEYLMPTSLFDHGARPKMKHPSRVLPKAAKLQFDESGRPHDTFFYTGFPLFYQLMHKMDMKLEDLKAHEDKMIKSGEYVPGKSPPPEKDSILLKGSVPIGKGSGQFGRGVTDEMYEQFVRLLQRMLDQPFANKEKEFLMRQRISLVTRQQMKAAQPLKYDEAKRPYVSAEGQRKKCKVELKVYGNGTGHIVLNGKELLDALPREIDREALLAPLQISGLLGKVDVEGKYTGPTGGASLAGAVRLGVARALESFVQDDIREKLRLAGLLLTDPRMRERKKPGRWKARKKYTWRKR